jgi:hypothetical protein
MVLFFVQHFEQSPEFSADGLVVLVLDEAYV